MGLLCRGGGVSHGIRYEMHGFMEQYDERYLEFANNPRAQLMDASTPSLEERNMTGRDFEDPGELPSIAAKVLIQPVRALARGVSRWNKACD